MTIFLYCYNRIITGISRSFPTTYHDSKIYLLILENTAGAGTAITACPSYAVESLEYILLKQKC